MEVCHAAHLSSISAAAREYGIARQVCNLLMYSLNLLN